MDARAEARRAVEHAVYAVGILEDEAWGDGWKEDGTGTPDRPRDLRRYAEALKHLRTASDLVAY